MPHVAVLHDVRVGLAEYHWDLGHRPYSGSHSMLWGHSEPLFWVGCHVQAVPARKTCYKARKNGAFCMRRRNRKTTISWHVRPIWGTRLYFGVII